MDPAAARFRSFGGNRPLSPLARHPRRSSLLYFLMLLQNTYEISCIRHIHYHLTHFLSPFSRCRHPGAAERAAEVPGRAAGDAAVGGVGGAGHIPAQGRDRVQLQQGAQQARQPHRQQEQGAEAEVSHQYWVGLGLRHLPESRFVALYVVSGLTSDVITSWEIGDSLWDYFKLRK